MGEELLSQLTSSAVVIYFIQILKRSSWFPWITAETKALNRWLAVVGSGASAAGIHLAYDGKAGALLITGLTVAGVAHGLWHWFQQYALTQLAYDATIDNKYVPKAGDLAITAARPPADLGTVDPKRFVAPTILLACVLTIGAAFSVTACGPKQYHTAVVANSTLAQSLFALQDAEIAAHNAKAIDDTAHAKYKKQILELLEAGDDLTLALRNWDPSKPVPANVGQAITSVQALLTDLHLESPTLSKVISAAQTVLSVLRGSGILPAGDFVLSQELFRRDRLAVNPEPFQPSDILGRDVSRVSRGDMFSAQAAFGVPDVVRFVVVLPEFLPILHPDQGGRVVGGAGAVGTSRRSARIPAVFVALRVHEDPSGIGTMATGRVDQFLTRLEDVRSDTLLGHDPFSQASPVLSILRWSGVLGEAASAVNHHFDRTAAASVAHFHEGGVFARRLSVSASSGGEPISKLLLRLPVARLPIAHDRLREIVVWSVAQRNRAVDRVLAVDVVAESARVLQRHEPILLPEVA